MSKLIAGTKEYNAVKSEILQNFSVVPTHKFQVKPAIRNRINYLKDFLRNSNRKTYVLGISGGVDSSTVGRLCQIACEELRQEGYPAKFIAVRLPAGVQKDEADAQAALEFISPDQVITINVGEAATNLCLQGVEQLQKIGHVLSSETIDYHKGNIKARLRMTAQYNIAGITEGLVVGTDHQCELVMGFYTLWGDQSCDLTVLNAVSKRQIRLMAKELGAPEFLWNKAPTADLEELNPGKLDDEGFGFPYFYLEDFLEGKTIPEDIETLIVNHFNNTRFKRSLLPGYIEERELS